MCERVRCNERVTPYHMQYVFFYCFVKFRYGRMPGKHHIRSQAKCRIGNFGTCLELHDTQYAFDGQFFFRQEHLNEPAQLFVDLNRIKVECGKHDKTLR